MKKLSLPNLSGLIKPAEKLINENAPVLLTAAGVLGVVATATLTAKATFKAADMLRNAKLDKVADNGPLVDPAELELSKQEKVLLLWKVYMPAVGVGALSCAAIIGAQHINSKRLAALTAAYAITERNFDEYKAKAAEKLGLTKEQKVRDEIAQDQVNANPKGQQVVYKTGKGDYPCFDRYTARYFDSSRQSLEQAMNEINATLLRRDHVSLNDVYSNFGLHQTSHGDSIGWRADGGLIELDFSTTVGDDGEPVLAFDFRPAPRPGYDFTH